MPAVVRIKRRIDEESVSAFVLHGKKRRLEDGSPASMQGGSAPGIAIADEEDEVTTILKLAGTVHDQDDSAISQYARLTKEEARELIEQKSRGRPTSAAPAHTERARAEMRKSLHESRFRVVNCLRSTLESNAAEGEGANEELTIVDIEKMDATPTDAAVAAAAAAAAAAQNNSLAEMPSTSSAAAAAAANAVGAPSEEFADSDTGYVYDFYLPANEYFVEAGDLLDDNYLSHQIRAFDFDTFYNDNNNDDDSVDYDSEDSNHENQPGNDYPDEEEDYDGDGNASDESDGTRQIRLAVENFVFDDGDEDEDDEAHSSDDEDVNEYQDPYVHSIDMSDVVDDLDVDLCDVDRYGLAYARYKKRVLKRLEADTTFGSDDYADDDDDDDNDDDDNDHDNEDEENHHRSESSSAEHFHSASDNESCA